MTVNRLKALVLTTSLGIPLMYGFAVSRVPANPSGHRCLLSFLRHNVKFAAPARLAMPAPPAIMLFRTPIVAAMSSSDLECPDHFNVNFGDGQTYTAEEHRSIPRASVNEIHVHGSKNGGIQVQGFNGNDIQVTACKYVSAMNPQEGEQRLREITLQIQSGDISVQGPSDNRWSVHFLIRAPKGLGMSLETYNGPMELDDVEGAITAHTKNGPLKLKSVAGTVNAETQNGPIDMDGGSGNITTSAINGPLTVRLSDHRWNGEGLVASTHNGPVHVMLPEGYESGVEVKATGHGPFACDMRECESLSTSKPWDSDKSVHIGAEPTVVHVSTINGPVQISNSME
jgi:hypothetical protein